MSEIFSYDLPEDRIAQRPVHPADSARMLVADRAAGTFAHRTFRDLPGFLREDDLLVLNNTRVVPARLFGTIEGTGADAEVLLLEEGEENIWRCLGRPLKKLKPGSRILFGSELAGEFLCRAGDFEFVMKFICPEGAPVRKALRRAGTMPIPPYIRDGKGDAEDESDYQTIFAEVEGSSAAPTASLHFTDRLLDEIRRAGCRMAFVTLHVGSASFRPVVQGDELREPDAERFSVPAETASLIAERRSKGGRVIAVGTTVVRALETAGSASAGGKTDLFIKPGHRFAAVDALVTNFHQPGTTHLLLVEAILGRTLLELSYAAALSEGYRFLSYGDGMFIV